MASVYAFRSLLRPLARSLYAWQRPTRTSTLCYNIPSLTVDLTILLFPTFSRFQLIDLFGTLPQSIYNRSKGSVSLRVSESITQTNGKKKSDWEKQDTPRTETKRGNKKQPNMRYGKKEGQRNVWQMTNR
ncbi:hypothetical protein BDM02DRAFT_842384 [Thelephora ganbajun]|uniref:Uncharacterized protein n=1 Tax=Thelephora ganbajun TaxID=370292 RepID=A0ACB6Z654_THEGA|nr:hypothetical protein BDM02DRAFT_842384 [Thelephora ganbajun]